MQADLNPSAVYTMPGLWHGVAEFGGFGEGLGMLTPGSDVREALCDRVRHLGEACNNLQGKFSWPMWLFHRRFVVLNEMAGMLASKRCVHKQLQKFLLALLVPSEGLKNRRFHNNIKLICDEVSY